MDTSDKKPSAPAPESRFTVSAMTLAADRWMGRLIRIGGVGVVLGLHHDLPLIGVLAAIGLVGMTIGAAFYHQKAGDAMKDWLPAVMIGSIAIFYAILRIATG